MAGRPTKLTPEVQDAICEHIRHGATLEVAAVAEGITARSLMNWRAWGQEAEEGTPHYELFHASERARAQFETDTLRRLATLDESVEAFDKDGNPITISKIDPRVASAIGRSLTWLLERTRRERYGTLVTVKVEEAKDYMLDTLERVCESLGSREVLVAVLEELAREGTREAGEATERAVH